MGSDILSYYLNSLFTFLYKKIPFIISYLVYAYYYLEQEANLAIQSKKNYRVNVIDDNNYNKTYIATIIAAYFRFTLLRYT